MQEPDKDKGRRAGRHSRSWGLHCGIPRGDGRSSGSRRGSVKPHNLAAFATNQHWPHRELLWQTGPVETPSQPPLPTQSCRFLPTSVLAITRGARDEPSSGTRCSSQRAFRKAPGALPRPPWQPPGRSYLQVPVDHGAAMHVFQPKDDLGSVEAHLLLRKDPVLGEVVVQVST